MVARFERGAHRSRDLDCPGAFRHGGGTSIFVAVNSPPGPRIRNRFDREILALALPALGALAADPLVSIVDTIFVGRLGVLPLAALGVNTSIFSMAFVVFNFLAYGTTPLVAREVGRGDREAAGRVVVQALVVAVLAGAVAVAFLQAFAGPITAAMGARGELQEASLSYLRIRAFAGPAVLIVTAGHGAFRGYLDTRTPLVVTIGLNLVNLVLDPLFIFGFGGGLEGAAIATLIAQWVGALWFVNLLLRRRREALGVRLRLPAMTDLLPFLRVGGELIVRTFALIGTLTLATAIATRVGMVAVAAHQVGSQLWLLLALVVDSLAVAAQAMVARYRGSGDPMVSRAASNRLLLWGLGTGVGLSLLFWVLEPLLPRIFTDQPEVLAMVREIYPFIVAMQPLNALVFVWDGIFLGLEEFRFVAVQMVLSGLAASIVLVLVIPFDWGLKGVWWGIVTLMAVRAVTLAIRYWRPATG
jgi:MATE family multidrug resistance protein